MIILYVLKKVQIDIFDLKICNLYKILKLIEEYFALVKGNGYYEHKRRQQARYWMYESINEHLRNNFYNNPPEVWKKWADMGVLCAEMESYALFATAAKCKKEALAILTISDSLITHKETTSDERVKSFTNMMQVALDCIKE